jgi:hypothetical protein
MLTSKVRRISPLQGERLSFAVKAHDPGEGGAKRRVRAY